MSYDEFFCSEHASSTCALTLRKWSVTDATLDEGIEHQKFQKRQSSKILNSWPENAIIFLLFAIRYLIISPLNHGNEDSFQVFFALLIPPIFEVNSYQIYQILFMDPYPKLEVESAKYASQKPRTFSGLSCSHGLSTWQVPKLHSWKFEDHGECCLNFFQNVWYQGVLYHFQIETGRFQEVKLYDRITFQVSDFLSSKASTTNRLPFGSPLEGCKTSVKFQIFPGNGVWNSGLLANPKLFHSEQFTKKKWWKRGFWWNDGIFWGLIFSHFHCKPRNSRKQTMPGVLMFWEMLLFSTWLWHGLTCSTDSTGIFQTHGQFFWAGILSLRL